MRQNSELRFRYPMMILPETRKAVEGMLGTNVQGKPQNPASTRPGLLPFQLLPSSSVIQQFIYSRLVEANRMMIMKVFGGNV